jgi:hypothetical protein
MKEYKVKAPDGSIIRIKGPENATDEQLIQAAQAAYAQKPKAPEVYDPTEGMTTAQKFLAGTGKAFVDVGRGVGQMMGLVSREDIKRARELDAPLMRTTAGTVGNVLGNVAAMTPAAFIPGANTAVGATTIGALSGLAQPSTSTAETLQNVGFGGAAGAALPAISATYRGGKSLIEPFYQTGREKIIGRALRSTGGAQADEAMRVFSQAKGATKGVQPTVGMAAQQVNLPSYAALERATQAVTPDVTNAVGARTAANQQAMQQALAEATPDIGAARTERENIAGALYEKARSQGIDQAMAQELAPQIQSLTQRLPDDVIARAKTLAQLSGANLDEAGSVQGLHWVKKALDDKISEATRAGSGDLARAYQTLQTQFLDTFDQLSSVYGEARKKYIELSKPVTQGEIMQDITNRATNMRGDITLGGLTRSATDRTAKSLTGMQQATLASTLTPRQQATIDALRNDLLSMDFASTAGRGGGSDTVQKLAYANMIQQAGIPTFLQNFAPTQIVGNLAQRALGLAYGEANQKLATELAEAMLNPQQAAELMRQAKGNPQLQKALANALRSSAVMGAATPGAIQAQREE